MPLTSGRRRKKPPTVGEVTMFSIRITALAVIAAGLACVSATQARADLVLDLSFNGGPFQVFQVTNDAGPISTSGVISVPNFSLNLTAQSNSPGTPSLADLSSTVLSIANTNTSGAASTIGFLLGAQGFMSPSGTVLLTQTIEGNATAVTPGDAVTLQSFLDTNNGQNNTGPGVQSLPTLNPPLPPGGGAFAASNGPTPVAGATTYSMTELFSVTLNPGDKVSFTT